MDYYEEERLPHDLEFRLRLRKLIIEEAFSDFDVLTVLEQEVEMYVLESKTRQPRRRSSN